MTIVIKRSLGRSKLAELLGLIKKAGKLDAYKHCGTITLKQSPIEIQKQMRDEWG